MSKDRDYSSILFTPEQIGVNVSQFIKHGLPVGERDIWVIQAKWSDEFEEEMVPTRKCVEEMITFASPSGKLDVAGKNKVIELIYSDDPILRSNTKSIRFYDRLSRVIELLGASGKIQPAGEWFREWGERRPVFKGV